MKEAVIQTGTSMATNLAHVPRKSWMDDSRLAALRELESSTPGLVTEVVSEFLATAPRHLGALRAASSAADSRTVHEVAHKLKGSCGLLGATEMAAVLGQLERAGQTGDLRVATFALDQLERQFASVQMRLEAELKS